MKKNSPIDPARNINLDSLLQDSKMTSESMESFLLEAIEQEEQKPVEQQDTTKLAVYEKALFGLRANKPLITRKEEGREKINSYLQKRSISKPQLSSTRRVILAFVCLVVIFLSAEVILNREWLFGRPSDDGQQYVIEGDEINVNLVSQGQADTESTHTVISTTKMSEVVEFLGYVPQIPRWIPDGWSMQTMNVEKAKGISRFAISYGNTHTKYILKYEIRTYENAERASAEFEQNDIGDVIQINGSMFYSLENTEIPALVWIDKLSVCSIQGPLSNEEMLDIVKSIE